MKKSNGGYIENVYSATGERLRSVQAVRMVDPGTSPGFTARTTLQYLRWRILIHINANPEDILLWQTNSDMS